jgi:hypothetical protein
LQFHAIKRVTDTINKSNSLRPVFVSRLRDAIFAINDVDIERVKADLLAKGWAPEGIEDLYKNNYSYFVRRCERKIPSPPQLLEAINKVIILFSRDLENDEVGYCQVCARVGVGTPVGVLYCQL